MVIATVGASRVEHARTPGNKVNVSRPERIASMIAGGALALYALKRRDAAGLPLALLGAELLRRGATGHCILYDALGMSTAQGHIPQRRSGELVSRAATVDARKAIKIERTIRIERPRSELFAIWRNFEALPRHVPDLESVRELGGGRSHWIANFSGSKRVEWDSELVNEIPNQLIAWKTVGDPDIAHAGSVHFKDAPEGGTEMRIVLDYEPPGGMVGPLLSSLARTFGHSPDTRMREDLRQFKYDVENRAAE
jgi:uncharacterized membrane protein